MPGLPQLPRLSQFTGSSESWTLVILEVAVAALVLSGLWIAWG